MYMAAVRVALLLLVACSSAKQPDAPSTASGTAAPAPAPAPAPAAKSADPDSAALRADVDIMCGAAKVTGGKTFIDVGPYIAEHMTTSYKVELFADARNATLDELLARMRALMAKANVTHCETVDVLVANDPRKQSPE
jgi:hypothetical protein